MTNRLSTWGPAAVWAAVLFFLSSLSGVDGPLWLSQGGDKPVHAGLYAVLGAALAWGRGRSATPPPAWVLMLIGAVYGVSDEWHQSFVDGRDASVGDWAADTAGVLLGYWIASTIVRRVRRSSWARRPQQTDPGPHT